MERISTIAALVIASAALIVAVAVMIRDDEPAAAEPRDACARVEDLKNTLTFNGDPSAFATLVAGAPQVQAMLTDCIEGR